MSETTKERFRNIINDRLDRERRNKIQLKAFEFVYGPKALAKANVTEEAIWFNAEELEAIYELMRES